MRQLNTRNYHYFKVPIISLCENGAAYDENTKTTETYIHKFFPFPQ